MGESNVSLFSRRKYTKNIHFSRVCTRTRSPPIIAKLLVTILHKRKISYGRVRVKGFVTVALIIFFSLWRHHVLLFYLRKYRVDRIVTQRVCRKWRAEFSANKLFPNPAGILYLFSTRRLVRLFYLHTCELLSSYFHCAVIFIADVLKSNKLSLWSISK